MSGMPKLASIDINRPTSRLRPGLIPIRPDSAPLPKISTLPIIHHLHRVDGARVELPFENEFVYQYFLQAVSESIGSQQQIQEVIKGRYAYVSLGGPNGADLTGPEGIHSPPGWDRAYVVNLDAFNAFCAKGVGFARKAKDAYQNQTYGLKESAIHLPFDINTRSQFIDHIVIGGDDYKDILSNATGAYAMLRLAFGLGLERGGMVVPLSIVLIKSFPVPRRDKSGNIIKDQQGNVCWENMAGWNYFTNPQIFDDKSKLERVGRYVRNQTSSRILKWICNRYNKRIENGQKVSRLVRWLVGRAFMKHFAPATYHYLGDSFRIGNAYRQLISNGYAFFEKGLVEQGLVSDLKMQTIINRAKKQRVSPLRLVDQALLKAYMDKILATIYQPAGVIRFPVETYCDLGTEEGRIAYLQEIRKMNPEQAEYIAGVIIQEIATQLGILHGVGGSGGGHEEMHPLGKISMVLQDRTTGKIVYVDMKIEGDDCVTQIFNDREGCEKIEGEIDLRGYKIVSMEADQHGKYKNGQPGGGAVRPDNLGYGLRDLHSIETSPSYVSRIIESYPTNLHGLEIGEAIYHFHCKIIQEAEMNLLFARNLGDALDGKTIRVPGAVHQLNALFRGGEEGLSLLENIFWNVYQKYYELSMQKYTPEKYQEVDNNQPIYIIHGSYRRKENQRELDEHLAVCSMMTDISDSDPEEVIRQELNHQLQKGRTLKFSDVIIGQLIMLDQAKGFLSNASQPTA